MFWVFAAVVLVLMVEHQGFRRFMISSAIMGAIAFVGYAWIAVDPDNRLIPAMWTAAALFIFPKLYAHWRKPQPPVVQPPSGR